MRKKFSCLAFLLLAVLYLKAEEVTNYGPLYATWSNNVNSNCTTCAMDTLLNGSPVAPLWVKDDLISSHWNGTNNLDDDLKYYTVKSVVEFGIDWTQPYFGAQDFSAELVANITYWDVDSVSHALPCTLTIDYDRATGAQVKSKDHMVFSQGLKFKVDVVSLTYFDLGDIGGTPLSSFNPLNVYLTGFITAERYRVLDPTPTYNPVITTGTGVQDRKLVNWSDIDGAEEYEIRWTFVSEHATPHIYNLSNNFTKVITKSSSYKIPVIYEEGSIVYAIRCLGRNINDPEEVIYGNWSLSGLYGNVDTLAGAHFDIGEFDEDKNWQYSISFAEEGRSKEVINYFDGTQRKRQTVTRNHTDNKAIVMGTIYDSQGRPAVETLPVPTYGTNQGTLHYYNRFNRPEADTTREYNYLDFDTTSTCDPFTGGMHNYFGSSNYYSEENPDLDDENGFLPDAKLFPFVQTEYTPDNTGRIRSKSGAGIDHRIGSEHETKYHYSIPFQPQLDRLFANDVGNSSHYLKEAVIDPNGTISVTYKNPAGKVIATSLAGAADSVTSLIPLESSDFSDTLIVNLIDTASVDTSQGRRTTVRYYTATTAGLHDFYYDLVRPSLSEICIPDSICYDCIYDLTFSIRNECGEEMLPDSLTFQTVGIIDTICDDSLSFKLLSAPDSTFAIALDVGTYAIYKDLKINTEAVAYYLQDYLERDTCLPDFSVFLDSAINHLDFSGCGLTCEECYEQLGSYESYSDSTKTWPDSVGYDPLYIYLTPEEYQDARDACAGLCLDSISPCDAMLSVLKADVSPGGQYAPYQMNWTDTVATLDVNNNLLADTTSLYSIFHLGSNSKLPHNYTYYLSSLQGIVGSGDSVIIVNDTIAVADLTASQLIAAWQPEWADILVQLHPEYCYYEFCVDNEASYIYDRDFLSTTSLDTAFARGYLNSLDNFPDPEEGPEFVEGDPFFYPNETETVWYDEMEELMFDFPFYYSDDPISIWYLAMAIHIGNPENPACFNDKFWDIYKGLYYSIKQQVLAEAMDAISNCPGFQNGGSFANDSVQPRYILTNDEGMQELGLDDELDSIMAYMTQNPPDTLSVIQFMNTLMEEQYQTQCEAYANAWLANIASCKPEAVHDTVWALVADSLVAELVEICVNGSDENNPFGSSTSPDEPSSLGHFTFEEAIAEFLNLHDIAFTGDCNPSIVSFPNEYGHSYGNTAVLDSCGCENVLEAYADYDSLYTENALPDSVCNIDDYFEVLFGGSILNVNDLVANCLLDTIIGTPLDTAVSCDTITEIWDNFMVSIGLSTSDDLNDFHSYAATHPSPNAFELMGDYYNNALVTSYGYTYSNQSSLDWYQQIKYCEAFGVPEDSLPSITCDVLLNRAALLSVSVSPFQQTPSFLDSLTAWVNDNFSGTYSTEEVEEKLRLCRNGSTTIVTVGKKPILNAIKDFLNTMVNAENLLDTTDVTAISSSLTDILFPEADTCDHIYAPEPYYPRADTAFNKYVIKTSGGDTVNTGWTHPLWCYGDHYFRMFTATWGDDALGNVTYGFTNLKGGVFIDDSLFTDDVESAPQFHEVIVYANNDTDSISFTLYSKFEVSTGNWDSLKMEVFIPNYQYGYDGGTFETVVSVDFGNDCDSTLEDGGTPEIELFKPDSSIAWEDITHFIGVSYVGKGSSLPSDVAQVVGTSKHDYGNTAVVAVTGVTSGGDTTTVYVTVPSSVIPVEDSVTVNYTPPPLQVPLDMSCNECMYCIEFARNWFDFLEANDPDYFEGSQIIPVFFPEYAHAFTNYLNNVSNNNLTANQVVQMADSCFRTGPDSIFAFTPYIISYFNELLEVGALSDYDTTFVPDLTTLILLGAFEYDPDTCNPTATFTSFPYPQANVNVIQIQLQDECGLDGEAFIFFSDTIDVSCIDSLRYILDLAYTEEDEEDENSMSLVSLALSCSSDTALGYFKMNTFLGIPYLDTLSHLCFQQLFEPVVIDTNECFDYLMALANSNAQIMYEQFMDSIEADFISNYNDICMGAKENYNMRYVDREYHFTLYYYDQAGNLMKTVPPKGVWMVKLDSMNTQNKINDHREDPFMNGRVKTRHSFNSSYKLNTLNQVVKETTPDAGTKQIWYDRLGRPVLSQTAQQQSNNAYSFTVYDELGRPENTGRLEFESTPTPPTISDMWTFSSMFSWVFSHSPFAIKEQVTTAYDAPAIAIPGFVQENLRGRVASVAKCEAGVQPGYDFRYDFATHYSYDIHGNVKSLVQEFPNGDMLGYRYFHIDYEYDLVSGNVKKVYYQRNNPDQFIHKYVYDADNRLSEVYTSTDDIIWHNEAEYDYYQHGPLARTTLGDIQVQGQDYAYTIQGWMKAVNAGSLNSTRDIGQDGNGLTASHGYVARDAYGFNLGYYNGDYQGIGGSVMFEPTIDDDFETAILHTGLFNGNITRMVTALMATDRSVMPVAGNAYHYDQLNRLKNKTVFLKNNMHTEGENDWTGVSTDDSYSEAFTYDANGNILTLLRNGTADTLGMDSLTYSYIAGTNKLEHVDDVVSSTNYSIDIDDQDTLNYAYDLDGNLRVDSAGGLESVEWNHYGKLRQIEFENGDEITFIYDAQGNRIVKLFQPDGGMPVIDSYIRDAQGNVMATYKTTVEDMSLVTRLEEHMLYGSSRMGVLKHDTILAVSYEFPDGFASDTTSTIEFYFYGDTVFPEDTIPYINPFDTVGYEVQIPKIYGDRNYELANHLGNVLSVITDRKVPLEDSTASDTLGYYEPWVLSVNDYYAFGSLMPDRNESSGEYRYGFNGMEKDDEIKGDGNSIDFKFRVYDSRLGRFLSVDPLRKDFAWNSTYAFAENDVIRSIDLEGLEKVIIVGGADIVNPGRVNNDLKTLGKAIKTYGVQNNIDVKIKEVYTTKYPTGYKGWKGYDAVKTIVDYATQNYDPEHPEQIIIYGYSLGGTEANKAIKILNEKGIKVDLFIAVDAANGPLSKPLIIEENVKSVANFYQTTRDIMGSRGYPAERASNNSNTDITNVNMDDEDGGGGWGFHHENMDTETATLSFLLITSTLTEGADDSSGESIPDNVRGE